MFISPPITPPPSTVVVVLLVVVIVEVDVEPKEFVRVVQVVVTTLVVIVS